MCAPLAEPNPNINTPSGRGHNPLIERQLPQGVLDHEADEAVAVEHKVALAVMHPPPPQAPPTSFIHDSTLSDTSCGMPQPPQNGCRVGVSSRQACLQRTEPEGEVQSGTQSMSLQVQVQKHAAKFRSGLRVR